LAGSGLHVPAIISQSVKRAILSMGEQSATAPSVH
jgi:hypothetical protein